MRFKNEQIVQDRRLKKSLEQSVKDGHKQQVEPYQAQLKAGRVPTVFDPDENVFVTYPLMRLTFYLYEPPAKAMFKIIGPLFLVLYLMLVSCYISPTTCRAAFSSSFWYEKG